MTLTLLDNSIKYSNLFINIDSKLALFNLFVKVINRSIYFNLLAYFEKNFCYLAKQNYSNKGTVKEDIDIISILISKNRKNNL